MKARLRLLALFAALGWCASRIPSASTGQVVLLLAVVAALTLAIIEHL